MEGEVFSLIGPKRFDVPWKEIEAQGISRRLNVLKFESISLKAERLAYATAEPENRYRSLRLHGPKEMLLRH